MKKIVEKYFLICTGFCNDSCNYSIIISMFGGTQMIEIKMAHLCSNCIHFQERKNIGKCQLYDKIIHQLETCEEWLGNYNSIMGIEKYMNSVRGHVSYKEKGKIINSIMYAESEDEKINLRRTTIFYRDDISKFNSYFAKSCSICTFAEGGKALRDCNYNEEKVHKFEVCEKWEVKSGKIKKLRRNKEKRVDNS